MSGRLPRDVHRLRQRSYETREGDKRTVIEMEVDEIGPSLRHATTKVTKASCGATADAHDEPPF